MPSDVPTAHSEHHHVVEEAANRAEAGLHQYSHPAHEGTTEAMRREEEAEHASYKYITLSNKGSEHLGHVPFGSVTGCAPNGTPAFSNGSDTHFSNTTAMWASSPSSEGSEDREGAGAGEEGGAPKDFYTGYQWQCVEFARRWLLQHRGILLPDVQIAAHIVYLTHMLHVPSGEALPIRTIFNGSFTYPTAGSVIVYPQSNENFVGHVGVIVEATESYVRVADQNRFFHSWGSKPYSAEFAVEKDAEGRIHIRDDVLAPIGWISFPYRPDSNACGDVGTPHDHATIDGTLYAGVLPSVTLEGHDAFISRIPNPKGVLRGEVLGGLTYLRYWCRSMGSFNGKALFALTIARLLAYVSHRAICDKLAIGKKTKTAKVADSTEDASAEANTVAA